MMRKILVAAVLGIILGVGLALIPAPQVSSMKGLNTALPQMTANNPLSAGSALRGPLTALGAVLLGALVAIPFFLLAKKRAQ